MKKKLYWIRKVFWIFFMENFFFRKKIIIGFFDRHGYGPILELGAIELFLTF